MPAVPPPTAFHTQLLSSVAAEADAQNVSNPTIYAGLRLLQIGSKQANAQLPPAASSAQYHLRPSPLKPPALNAVTASATDEVAEAKRAHELARALAELEELREKLNAAEMAETVAAVKVIEIANEGLAARAATAIQAGYHGAIARNFVRELCADAVASDAAATAIQSSFHGAAARRTMREQRADAKNWAPAAATAIQAGFHGATARRHSDDQRRGEAQKTQAATAIQAGFHGATSRRHSDDQRRGEEQRRLAATVIQSASHGMFARVFCRALREDEARG